MKKLIIAAGIILGAGLIAYAANTSETKTASNCTIFSCEENNCSSCCCDECCDWICE